VEVRERMGLRVVEVTLRSDWDAQGILADVRGAVWIDKLECCVLQPDLIEEIVELLAAEVAHETLEQHIQINSWRVERSGDRFEVTAQSFTDTAYETPKKSPYFNQHAADVRPVNGWNS
jgi:hypothetical protein